MEVGKIENSLLRDGTSLSAALFTRRDGLSGLTRDTPADECRTQKLRMIAARRTRNATDAVASLGQGTRLVPDRKYLALEVREGSAIGKIKVLRVKRK